MAKVDRFLDVTLLIASGAAFLIAVVIGLSDDYAAAAFFVGMAIYGRLLVKMP